jgi:hypothetical protein
MVIAPIMNGPANPPRFPTELDLFGIRNAIGIAGVLDLTQACILFGSRIPVVIAGGLTGPAGFTWRCRHLCSRCLLALLHRLLSSGCLLRGKPQAGFFDRTSAGVRLVLWQLNW